MQKIKLHIAGQEINVVSEESSDIAESYANEITARINAIKVKSSNLKPLEVALICTLGFCSEAETYKKIATETEKKVEELSAALDAKEREYKKLLDETADLRQKNETMREIIIGNTATPTADGEPASEDASDESGESDDEDDFLPAGDGVVIVGATVEEMSEDTVEKSNVADTTDFPADEQETEDTQPSEDENVPSGSDETISLETLGTNDGLFGEDLLSQPSVKSNAGNTGRRSLHSGNSTFGNMFSKLSDKDV